MQGDSGSPLMCKQEGKWVTAGQTSFGYGYCMDDGIRINSVYTKVSYFVNWIRIQCENRV